MGLDCIAGVACLRRLAGLAGLAALVFLAGCSSRMPYDQLGRYLHQGDCAAAAALMEASAGEYPDNDTLLFLLDSAVVHMQCREYERAQEKFRAAEDLAQSLWTASLSREVAAYLTNDYVLQYGGEDFERAMIHLMSALAYVDEGQPREALVECRRLDSLLTLFNDRYEKKNRYKEDAFGRYLSGLLREGGDDPDGAVVDYLKAADAYEDHWRNYGVAMPDALKADLFRAAQKAGRVQDAKTRFPGYAPEDATGQKKGELVLIRLKGQVPQKEADRILIPTKYGPLTLAFPVYPAPGRPDAGEEIQLRSDRGKKEVITTVLASDLGAIAVKNLADRRARITAKAVARAAAKQILIHQATKDQDKEVREAVRTLFNLANTLFEQADLRSWQTLPRAVYIARASLDPGQWTATFGSGENNLTKKVLVKAGQIHYIIVNHGLGSAFL